MKQITTIFNIMLVLMLLFVLVASIGSALLKQPLLLSVIRSNSMYPVFERGDMVIVKRVTENDQIYTGDIVIFTTEEGNLSDKGWIMHRVMAGNAAEGYITQGDANSYTDQDCEGTGPIKPEWIVSKAVTVGEKPIVIPWLGHFPLKMEEYQSNPYMLPALAVLLAIILGVSEIMNGRKKKRKSMSELDVPLMYLVGGMTIAVGVGATMLATSQQINIPYAVSEKNSNAVLMGSNVGTLKVGEEIERDFTKIENNGFFPLIATFITKDEQISLNHHLETVSSGEQLVGTLVLNAQTPGSYDSSIRVGLFYPFLPKKLVYYLANKSYWLALVVVSFVPAIPIIIYPFLDKQMNRKVSKAVTRKIRKLSRIIAT